MHRKTNAQLMGIYIEIERERWREREREFHSFQNKYLCNYFALASLANAANFVSPAGVRGCVGAGSENRVLLEIIMQLNKQSNRNNGNYALHIKYVASKWPFAAIWSANFVHQQRQQQQPPTPKAHNAII